MARSATICVEVRDLYPTVIPSPLKDKVEDEPKFAPFTVKLAVVCPWIPESGEIDVIEGVAALVWTAIVTEFDATPPIDSTTGRASPVGAFAGTCAFT